MSVYAFAKIDGSNIRAEWNRKQGFYKFGSRKRLLGSDQLFIEEAKNLIKAQEKQFEETFRKNKWDRVIVFFEFWGDNSFAGIHLNETHRVTLIDANPYKVGIIPPKEFINVFKDFDIAPLLYHGFCDGEFINSVKNNKLNDMPLEGVVCKAKNHKKTPVPVMFKIKSNAWIEKLREHCAGDEKKFELLL